MSIRIGASTLILDFEAVREKAKLVDVIELGIDCTFGISGKHIRLLRQIKDEEGINYTVHAPFRDLNLASPNPKIYRVSKDLVRRSLDIAAALGAELLVVHPGKESYYPSYFHDQMKKLESNFFSFLAHRAERKGILVAAENLINAGEFFEDSWTFEGPLKLIKEISHPFLGLCFDFGHVQQSGFDVPEMLRYILDESRDNKRKSVNKLFHLHIHDNPGEGVDEHLPLGAGTINWRKVWDILEENTFNGIAVIENFGENYLEQSLKYLKSIGVYPAKAKFRQSV